MEIHIINYVSNWDLGINIHTAINNAMCVVLKKVKENHFISNSLQRALHFSGY